MNGSWLHRARTAIVSAIGVTILMGVPLLAQADQGKWWKPKEGDRKSERSDRSWQDRGDRANSSDRGNRGGRGNWSDRGNGGGRGNGNGGNGADRGNWSGRTNGGNSDRAAWRDRTNRGDRITWRDPGNRVNWRDRGDRANRGTTGDIRFRNRRYSGQGSWGGYSTWRGYPVRRDILRIRDDRYGGYFRARRIYCAPRFAGRFVYVRPVRFFVSAAARIGGLNIRARIVRPHYLYGCNFCDARFDTYDSYAAHVAHCDHRPSGLQISVSNWGDDFDSYWDGPYQAGDDYQYDDNYHDDSYNNDGYYDDGTNGDGSYGDGNYDAGCNN